MGGWGGGGGKVSDAGLKGALLECCRFLPFQLLLWLKQSDLCGVHQALPDHPRGVAGTLPLALD